MVSYSFGAIVTLDTLFPTTAMPSPAFAKVDKLVTIGCCPVEFATAMHSDWLSGRKNRDGVPKSWLNIYSPVDLLGSDFTVTDKTQPDPPSIELVPPATGSVVKPTTNHTWDLGIEPTWGNLIEFYGFDSHGMYWGTDKEVDDNVFRVVVNDLYGGTTILT